MDVMDAINLLKNVIYMMMLKANVGARKLIPLPMI